MTTPNKIRKGDLVRIRPEWRDEGDDCLVWVALEDEDGGRVKIQPQLWLTNNPVQVVETRMIERIEEAQ